METIIKDLNLILDYSTVEKKRNAKVLNTMQLLEIKVSEAVDFLDLMGYFSNKVDFESPSIVITGSKHVQNIKQFKYSIEFSALPIVISSSKKSLCKNENEVLKWAIR